MEKIPKPLNKLKFDTVGEEFIYLYETLHSKDIQESKEEMPSIEDLRQKYNLLVNEKQIKDKYSKSSIYWSEKQEKAIIEYIKEKDPNKKNIIFSKHLYKPFKKLIENIIFTYKLFRNDVEVSELQHDCMSFLITKINKFNPISGAKSFAYFGTIAKHYLMGEKKTIYKMTKTNINIEETQEEINEKIIQNPHNESVLYIEMALFRETIESIEKEIQSSKTLPNDKKVGEAIVWIFKNHELLNVYNKNLVYHLLKERTGLQTKEITYSLSRFKGFYKLFKEDFLKKNT